MYISSVHEKWLERYITCINANRPKFKTAISPGQYDSLDVFFHRLT